MRCELFLADAATADASGRLNVLGQGWTITGPSPLTPHVLCFRVGMEPGSSEAGFTIGLRLLRGDGEVVMANTMTVEPVKGILRPPNLGPGAYGVMQLIGLPLEPGAHEWHLDVDGVPTGATAPFYVRATVDEFPPINFAPADLSLEPTPDLAQADDAVGPQE